MTLPNWVLLSVVLFAWMISRDIKIERQLYNSKDALFNMRISYSNVIQTKKNRDKQHNKKTNPSSFFSRRSTATFFRSPKTHVNMDSMKDETHETQLRCWVSFASFFRGKQIIQRRREFETNQWLTEDVR